MYHARDTDGVNGTFREFLLTLNVKTAQIVIISLIYAGSFDLVDLEKSTRTENLVSPRRVSHIERGSSYRFVY